MRANALTFFNMGGKVMSNITTEVNHFMVDGKLVCVVTTYQDGSFLCDSRPDVKSEVHKVIEGISVG